MQDDAAVVAVRATGDTEGPLTVSAPERATAAVTVRALRAVWLWPSALTAVVVIWRLGRPEMWQDELVTIDVAGRSLHQIRGLLDNTDAVHGAYYLFMHFWVRAFGDSAVALRLPSALAMVAAAGCVGLVGQRLVDRTTGLLAGVAFALIPAVTRFGQEVRSYAFVVLFAALATLALLRAVERSTVPRWLAYAACVCGLVLLNAVALTIVVGHAAGLLTRGSREARPWRLLIAFAVAVVVGLLPATPVLYLGTQQAASQLVWVAHAPVWVVWPQIFASSWLAWALLPLAALAWLGQRRAAGFATAVALAPLPVVWLASLGSLSYFFSKYLLFILPAWALLAGLGLRALGRRPVMAAGVVLLAAAAFPGQVAMRGTLSHSWYDYPDPRSGPAFGYREAAELIATDYEPGDGIVYLRAPFWWLLADSGVRYYLPDDTRPRDVFLSQTAASADALHAIECPYSAQCIGREQRIWLVVPEETQAPLSLFSPDQVRALDSGGYSQVWIEHPPGMTVALLQRAK